MVFPMSSAAGFLRVERPGEAPGEPPLTKKIMCVGDEHIPENNVRHGRIQFFFGGALPREDRTVRRTTPEALARRSAVTHERSNLEARGDIARRPSHGFTPVFTGA